MTNDIETVEQVCEEFKTPKYTCKNCDFKICPSINAFSGRVLAARKREIADEKRISDAVIKSLRNRKLEKDREVAEKDNEIARLRAALKTVLECKVMSAMTAEIEPGKSEYCAAIIEKAQRIYNEGEENQNEGGAK